MSHSTWLRACGRTAFMILIAGMTAAAEAHPGGSIAVDRRGSVYFADTWKGVWRIDSAGKLSFLGGPRFHWLALDEADRFTRFSRHTAKDEMTALRRVGGPNILVSSDYPIAIANGSLCFADGDRQPFRLVRTDPGGSTRDAGTFPAASTNGRSLEWLNGLAAAPDGRLYATADDSIFEIARDGTIRVLAHDIEPPDCRSGPTLDAPPGPYLRGLAIAANGDLYVASTGCHSVLKITPKGAVTRVLASEDGWSPTAVAVSGRNVYVLEYDHSPGQTERTWPPRVRKLGASGKVETLATIHH